MAVRKKILLVQPPKPLLYKADGSKEGRQTLFPLGFLYLAVCAKREGYDVQILDIACEGFDNEEFVEKTDCGDIYRFGLSDEEVVRRVRAYDPDIVGISCLFSSSADEAHKTAKLIKQVKNVPLFMGGAHPTATPCETLEDKNVDYVVMGEGEISFIQALKKIANGESLSEIDGFAYREKDTVKVNPKTHWIEDLDTIPWPARELIDLKKYSLNYYKFAKEYKMPHTRSMLKGSYTPMLSSRGCPHHCYYCSKDLIWGLRYRARKIDDVCKEIQMLKDNYGIEEIHFEDDNWAAVPDRAKEMCREFIKRKWNIAFGLPNGMSVFSLDEELIDLMKKAGFYSFTMSIESGCPRVINEYIKKPIDLDKAKRIYNYAKGLGFEIFVCFMIGFPGETMEEIKKTIAYADELGTDNFGFSIVTPLAGTGLAKLCREKGYLVDNFDVRRLRWSVGNIKTNEFDPGTLENLRRTEFLRILKKRGKIT